MLTEVALNNPGFKLLTRTKFIFLFALSWARVMYVIINITTKDPDENGLLIFLKLLFYQTIWMFKGLLRLISVLHLKEEYTWMTRDGGERAGLKE